MTKTENIIIRPAHLNDAMSIYTMIQNHKDDLIPRPIGDIIGNIDRFIVCEIDSTITGCAAWAILPEIGDPSKASIEIKSVAVKKEFRRHNIGSQLVRRIIESVQRFGPCQAIVLTFAPEFFTNLGFHEISKASVMHKLYMGCINCTKYTNPYTCPEIAMALDLRKPASVNPDAD
jgi:N-acetylglutamate synthase-like GNAT family acetyltransferase